VVAIGSVGLCVRGHVRSEVGAQRECGECHRERQRLGRRLERLYDALAQHELTCRISKAICPKRQQWAERIQERQAELDAFKVAPAAAER